MNIGRVSPFSAPTHFVAPTKDQGESLPVPDEVKSPNKRSLLESAYSVFESLEGELKKKKTGMDQNSSVKKNKLQKCGTFYPGIKKVYDSGCFADVCLEVEGTVFFTHKVLLSRIEYFNRMLNGSFKEGSATMSEAQGSLKSISLSGTPAKAFKALLQFIYTGLIKLSESNVVDLYVQSDKFGVVEIKELCCLHVDFNVNAGNCLKLFQQAYLKSAPQLLEHVFLFIAGHASRVLSASNADFLKLPANILLEILRRDELFINELDLFFSLVEWFRFDKGRLSDEEAKNELLSCIRLHKIPLNKLWRDVAEAFVDGKPLCSEKLLIDASKQAAKDCGLEQIPLARSRFNIWIDDKFAKTSSVHSLGSYETGIFWKAKTGSKMVDQVDFEIDSMVFSLKIKGLEEGYKLTFVHKDRLSNRFKNDSILVGLDAYSQEGTPLTANFIGKSCEEIVAILEVKGREDIYIRCKINFSPMCRAG